MKKILSLVITLSILGGVYFVQAQSRIPSLIDDGTLDQINHQDRLIANSYNPATDENTLPQYIAQIIAVFLGLLAVIFIILLILAGYNWLTAAGKEEKVEKAQKIIRYAVIGLIVIIAAYAITYWIFARLPE